MLKQFLSSVPERYSPGELAMLREENYSIDSQGNLVARKDRFIPLKQNFRFTIELLMRHGFPQYKLDCGGDGYQAFVKALDIRHDITHPKDKALIEITNERLQTVSDALGWFTTTNDECFDKLSDQLGFHK
jgi:hypothetical protein